MNRFDSWEVLREPKFVSETRKQAHAVLVTWGLHDTDDVLLMLTELVTNALAHGEGRVFVSLTWDGAHDQLVCAVGDGGDGQGIPRVNATNAASRHSDDELAESGRGLTIVSTLSTDWGVTPGPDGIGKAIWFCWTPDAQPL